MNNENMYEEVNADYVDFDTNGCDSTDESNSSQISGAAIAAIAGVVVAVGAGIGAILYANRDKLREKRIQRLEKKAHKYGFALVDADSNEA